MFRFLVTVLALHSASGLVLNGALPQQAAVMPAYGRSSSSACVMMAKKEGKKVTVVLEREVEGLGAAGELVEVKPAYAENFIVAKGIGSIASKELIAKIQADIEEEKAKALKAKKVAEEKKEMLMSKYAKGLVTEVQMKDGKIAEPVDAAAVAKMLARAGVAVEAGDIVMPEVTELGSVLAEVTMHPEVTHTIKIDVQKSKITFS